ncbi:MAG: transcription antitermination factor NusB [Paracoccus sp. (in: a-proteobacteria)]|jgi:N utilization substance protein B|uniref:transcription antitermination factor NusB n=1 Tax=unclassified Paracoccus (in: a-proteobacteria) TaxID=2688777 RepID=UPI000C667008|nr:MULTISPECIES: transcription antitermination factor NusB [unclassified Paracoccus (in: a-proteobacteria)]MAN55083.1 transcription antitermination factor NusB [Paracoccus sp. (in: a-proteobacteria)]MBA50158.1 transcription antitermination factor NusB [Paracoccus sp. (in: a-proteobacteria)]MCS5602053.1 transcription antitermination factor NusB [Paracoccus sp. (in: a-proteobacteria)]MDB2552530.1 transcription antitermination factor NusB [Paracoccus sp. (in: a-proteobacteria)]|tara:strand:- start:2501 stop:2992 length:492 start_codon:yes stop_codon:yes gene_type:complete
MTEARQNSRSGSDRRALSGAARLYAVQALFQMEAAGQSADRVQREFETYRIGAEDEEGQMPEADRDLFMRIVDQAVTWQSRIDQATDRGLVAKWPIDRIDPVLRALFRAGGAELAGARTPPKVVITEYVRIAEAFFPDGREPKFVNGVLDHMARDLRPDAFDG